MKFSDLAVLLKARLQTHAELVKATIVIEDDPAMEAEIEKSIGKTGLLIVIGTPEFDPSNPDSKIITGNLELEIAFWENAIQNRGDSGSGVMAMDAAQYAVQMLQGWKPTFEYRWLKCGKVAAFKDTSEKADPNERLYSFRISADTTLPNLP